LISLIGKAHQPGGPIESSSTEKPPEKQGLNSPRFEIIYVTIIPSRGAKPIGAQLTIIRISVRSRLTTSKEVVDYQELVFTARVRREGKGLR
jgi:hypothetical protein